MAIGIDGITLYRPNVEISTKTNTDSNGNAIGQVDTVTYTDTVYVSDNPNLLDVYDAAVSLARTPNDLVIDYPGNSGARAQITSISAEGSSDFIHKLVYKMTFDAVPIREIYSPNWKISGNRTLTSYGLESAQEDGLMTEANDVKKVILPAIEGSGSPPIYYSKPPLEYSYSLSITTRHTNEDFSSFNTKEVMDRRTNLLQSFYGNLNNYLDPIITSYSLTKDGPTINFSMNSLYFPADSSGYVTYQDTLTEQTNLLAGSNTRSKSYSYTFKGYDGVELPLLEAQIAGSPAPDDGIQPTKVGGLASARAASGLNWLKTYFFEEPGPSSGVPEIEIDTPDQVTFPICVITKPVIGLADCYNVRNVSTAYNSSENTYTLTIDRSTERINCDGSGWIIEWDSNSRYTNNVVFEAPGWSQSGYIIQNFNTFKDTYIDYSVKVSSQSQCPGTGLQIIDVATGVLNRIMPTGTGTITNYVTTVNNNTCTLAVTWHSGVNQTPLFSGIAFTQGSLNPGGNT